MPSQSELIGEHPVNPHFFDKWLFSTDHEITASKNHRALASNILTDEEHDEIIEWLSDLIIKHHYSDEEITALKEQYSDLGYPLIAEQNRKLPLLENTKKGNLAELVLFEYVNACLNTELFKMYRLRYNPNVDQSMKGDDCLLLKYSAEQGNEVLKIYLGEAKFRETPVPAIVREIAKTLGRNKSPLSMTYLISDISRNGQPEIAKKLSSFLIQNVKELNSLIYAGFLFSNSEVSDQVEKHLDSDNEMLIFISLGLKNPVDLVSAAYAKAEEKIKEKQL
jgi:hypothetical protein